MLAQRAAMYSAAVYGQLSSGMSALDEGTATKYIESLIEYVLHPPLCGARAFTHLEMEGPLRL